ncbi:unnamed protein product [Paramecium sonneborni]|uniref:Transmembrane protein n=1 Tax=Paramecium sonneborni TaxID=65129 RepID=A0A8S1RSI0_9CILI|nr:unnamed protein product [Paramecium sonneborni]
MIKSKNLHQIINEQIFPQFLLFYKYNLRQQNLCQYSFFYQLLLSLFILYIFMSSCTIASTGIEGLMTQLSTCSLQNTFRSQQLALKGQKCAWQYNYQNLDVILINLILVQNIILFLSSAVVRRVNKVHIKTIENNNVSLIVVAIYLYGIQFQLPALQIPDLVYQ